MLIQNLYDHTYDDFLIELSLPSLKYWRSCGDMIMIYQLLHNNLNIDSSELLSINSSSINRGHNYKPFKPQSSTLARSF